MHFKTYFDRFTGARGAKATEMTKHGLSTTKWCRPTCKSTRATRSTTNGYQKPTIPYERWKRDLARLHAWVETKSCMQLFDGEHDRGELACSECLSRRYYLPCAQKNFTSEELKGMLVGKNIYRGYSSELVDLP